MPKHLQVIDGEKFSSHAFHRKQTQRGNVTTYIPQSILTNRLSTDHGSHGTPERPPVPRRRVWRYQRAGAKRPRCPSWRIPGFFQVDGKIPMIPMCLYVINKHRNKWININILHAIINNYMYLYIYIYIYYIYIFYIYITYIIYTLQIIHIFTYYIYSTYVCNIYIYIHRIPSPYY